MLRFITQPLRKIITLKRFLILFSFGLLALLGYCIYLDKVVVAQFEGKRFSLPAKVYARPLELYVGKSLTVEDFQWELGRIRYKKSTKITAQGQYLQAHNQFFIFTKPFTFWDGVQPERGVAITVKNGRVTSLKDHSSGANIDIMRLEPYVIGGIYPNKNEDRELVRYEQLPRYFLDALVAVEDQRFYSHRGIDPRGIARAIVATALGKGIQGGSTLTQQLVKNFFLTPERTVSRKLKEMLMAILLERRYEKNDILETYVNEVYFGQDKTRAIHGVALASEFYFGSRVEQMQLHQAALLVAMLKGPAVYNPRRHPQRAMERRNVVLQQLFEQGYIPEWQFNKARAMPLSLINSPGVGAARYPAFLDLVFRQLREDYKESDLRSEGLRIFTTLDPVVQKAAETSLASQLNRFEKNRALTPDSLEGAVVISSAQTGEVEALVGGRRVKYEGFNRALDAKRQAGSLLKPAIMLTALEQPSRYVLTTLLDDTELVWQERGAEPWTPNNYDKQFHGSVPLWAALAHSYNVASARLGLALGVDNVIATAKRLGVSADMPFYPSTLLGTAPLSPFEVTQMYQSFASGGYRIPLRGIRDVVTLDGKPLKRYGVNVKQVIDAQAAHLINRALELVVSEGTGKSLLTLMPRDLRVAGKTGTTDQFRDSWFAGYSGDKVGVVWVGSDSSVNTGLTGASGAMKIWGHIFSKVALQPIRNLLPENIVVLPTDYDTGGRVKRDCDNMIALPFIKGSEPLQTVSCHQKQTVQKRDRIPWWKRVLGR